MKKNRAALEAGNPSDKDYQNLVEQVKSNKKLAIIFGLAGGAGWISTGICGYKWRQGSKAEGSSDDSDGEDDPEKYKIPLPKGYKGNEGLYFNDGEVRVTKLIALKNLADNEGVEPTFENIYRLLEKDEENKQVFFNFLRLGAGGRKGLEAQYRKENKIGNESAFRICHNSIIAQGKKGKFDGDIRVIGRKLEKYKQDPDAASKNIKLDINEGFRKQERTIIELIVHARGLSELDEDAWDYIPAKL